MFVYLSLSLSLSLYIYIYICRCTGCTVPFMPSFSRMAIAPRYIQCFWSRRQLLQCSSNLADLLTSMQISSCTVFSKSRSPMLDKGTRS